MRLSKEVLKKLKRSLNLRQGLAYKTGVSERTIANRVKANSELLTTADSLAFLQSELKLTREEILTPVEA